MTAVLLQFVAAAAVIVVAGTFLSRFGDEIAEITGLGRLLVGSVLVAGATSLPELAVDVTAVRLGLGDVAIGDLAGSSLFNLLILGVLDLTHRSQRRMFSHASARHALAATGSMALTALAAASILLAATLAPYAVGRVGVGSIAILVAYVLTIRLVYQDQRYFATREAESAEPATEEERSLSLRWALLGFGIAAGAILAAAPFLAEAAGELAERTGLGQSFVGTALVALCTSLPELVASLAALRMGAIDMAIGNVFGSNALNMVLFVLLDLVSDGPLLAGVSSVHAVTCLATIVVTAVIVMGLLYQVERRIQFVEPDAALVILLVLGALGLVYAISTGSVPDPTG